MGDEQSPYAVLRIPAFRRLLIGNILASIGSEMLHVAAAWELYVRTDRPGAIGLVGLVQFLPVLVLSLLAGQAADRYPRHKLYALAQGITAVAALGMAALSLLEGPIPLVYLCLVLVGVARAFSAPSRSSLMPLLVPPHLLTRAVAWGTGGWQVATVAGPALGGLILAFSTQAGVVYFASTVCALITVLLLVSLNVPTPTRAFMPITIQSLLAGLDFVWRTRLILAPITLDLFAVLLGGAVALLPVYARDILDVGAVGLGWLRAAPALGALAMAFLLAHLPPMRRAGWALLGSIAGFGVATIVFGLSTNVVLSLIALALTGALDNVSVVIRHTLVQKLTPDEMRGRVSAVNLVFISSSNELGAFESGIVAEFFGPVVSVVGGGIGTLLVVFFAAVAWPEVRRLGSLHDLGRSRSVS